MSDKELQAVPRILFVSDEQIDLRLFDVTFKKEYSVTTANSASEALKLIKNADSFDIIVSDQKMPNMSGTEFMIEAKKILTEAKFILLTSYTDAESLSIAVNDIGIYKCIKKPYEPHELRHAIDDAYSDYQKAINTVRFLEKQIKKLAAAKYENAKTKWLSLHEKFLSEEYLAFRDWHIEDEDISLIFNSSKSNKTVSLEFDTYDFMLSVVGGTLMTKNDFKSAIISAHYNGQSVGIAKTQNDRFAKPTDAEAEKYFNEDALFV